MMQQNTCSQCKDQKQLMNLINEVSFVLDDTLLYLDTHPDDKEALQYFQHYNKIRQEALKDYAMKYGPLTLDSMSGYEDKWKWVYDKWPWEGGIC